MAAQDAWIPDMAIDLADEGSPEVEDEALKQQLNKFKAPYDEGVALAAAEELESSSSSSEGPSNQQPSAGRTRCPDAACKVTFERKCDQKRHYKSKHLEERPTCPYCGQKRCRPDSLKRHILTSYKVKEALDALKAAVEQEADQEADQEAGQEAGQETVEQEAEKQPQKPQGDVQDYGSQRKMACTTEGLRESDGPQAEDRQEEGSRGKLSRPHKRRREELEDEDGSQEEDGQQEGRPAKIMRRPVFPFSRSLR